MLFDKYKLKEDLQNGVYTIVFEKVDGTIREMRATLDPQFLAENASFGENEMGISRGNDHVLAVWSVDDNGWRSMRVENIQTVMKE